eukprot:COSAG04_NODE_17950_length_455_cov_0.862360_1_plen_151_part_11
MGMLGWVAVAATAGPSAASLTVDLSHLPPGKRISAVRYAVGSGGYNSTTGQCLVRGLGSSRICCGPSVDTALQPCGPERCPIKASGLPARPFFAAVDKATGQCKCFAPQRCDGTVAQKHDDSAAGSPPSLPASVADIEDGFYPTEERSQLS